MFRTVKEAAMRRRLLATAGAAIVLASLSTPAPARAFETVVGGLAGACSRAAKEGRSDSRAMDLCSKALAGEPLNGHDRAGTYVNRGAMRLMNRDYDLAHADFQAALRIMPKMGEAMIGEGGYLISMERWPEAEAWISRGIAAGSEESEKAYYFRGIARWAQDDFKGAYLDFRKASELKPNWRLPKQQLTHFQVRPAS
jgi:tetratricopeptide (TPR) repeat protein